MIEVILIMAGGLIMIWATWIGGYIQALKDMEVKNEEENTITKKNI